MLAHNSCSSAQHNPGKQGTDQGIADTDPSGGNSVFVAELSCISYKNHSTEIGRTVGKSRQPRTDTSASEYKAVHVGGMFTGIKTDSYHYGKKQY